MNLQLKSALLTCGLALAVQAAEASQITFYEGAGYRGRAFTTDRRVENFKSYGFNDRASSVVVDSGRWQACENTVYTGRCVVLRPGAYDSLKSMGLNDRITSVRLVNDDPRYNNGDQRYNNDDLRYDYAPTPQSSADYEFRRRPNEHVYQAHVTSARAVMGPPDRHCWVEQEQVRERGDRNVGGAVVGAVIGGVLGHQIGSGTGRTIATVGGAVVGGAVGSNVNRGHDYSTRNVERCETSQNDNPDYYDVTYKYRGVEHYAQMTAPPGKTILVNSDGEPRQ
jgi:uncharacterized protein YcfJ